MAEADAWLAVGRVLGAFGIRGELKTEPWSTPEASVLNSARRWRFTLPDGMAFGPDKHRLLAALPFALPAELVVAATRRQGDAIIVGLAEPLSREQAEAMKGLEIQVSRADFPPPAEDEFYHADLVGCAVVNRGGVRLGTVAEVDDHGVQALLRLDNDILIPFVAAHVLTIDPVAREIVVDWEADWL